MKDKPVHDIAILGGGCTAMLFALSFIENSAPGSILVLEQQNQPTEKNWSFWIHDHEPINPEWLRGQWNHWQFSYKDSVKVHTSRQHRYVSVNSIDLYQLIQRYDEKHSQLQWINDQSVNDAEPCDQGFRITTQNDVYTAKWVIDTRSLGSTSLINNYSLFQQFVGLEVKTKTDCFSHDTVGLMDRMTYEDEVFSFVYTLPFEPNRALVEYTVFSEKIIPKEKLRSRSYDAIHFHTKTDAFQILAEEQGLLPMGQTQATKPNYVFPSHYIRAGSQAGTLRASSGYGFMNTYRWVQHAVQHWKFSQSIPNVTPQDKKIRWMDHLFVDVLRAQPSLQPVLFMKMARSMSPDAFATFMTGNPSLKEMASMALAMPICPFMKTLLRRHV